MSKKLDGNAKKLEINNIEIKKQKKDWKVKVEEKKQKLKKIYRFRRIAKEVIMNRTSKKDMEKLKKKMRNKILENRIQNQEEIQIKKKLSK